MSHNYYQSLEYEKKWHPIADAFYYSKYPNCNIKRYDTQSVEDIQLQKKDIDCSILCEDRTIHISEKFRTKNYGDLLIELYSKYSHTLGWSKESEAEFLAYFAERQVYIISMKDIKNTLLKIDTEGLLEIEIEKFHYNNLHKSAQKKIVIETIPLSLIQAYNKLDNANWHTISIAIRWEEIQKLGVGFKRYPTQFIKS